MSDWIDEIDDIDAFLDQLIEVNENCTSAPSLDAFCSSFALDTANGMYDDIYKKFLDWNAFGEECTSECNYMQDLKCVIESLELALKDIKKE